jgi:hypothetical protein
MSARDEHARRSRIEVALPPWASARQQRELNAFSRYCIARLERDLGEVDRWVVAISLDRTGGFSSAVSVELHGALVEARGAGHDGTLAIWDALCNIEQTLREQLRAAPRA